MSQAKGASLSYEDGARAVELARQAVESYVQNGQREQPGSMRDAFYTRTGAFVRIESVRGRGSLRGCAGRYDTADRLGHVLVDEAIHAASDDSCGSEIRPAELQNVTISVCAVTDLFETTDPVSDVELGRHGVALETPDGSGWLYPTVPVEHGWSVQEYLSRIARKVGIPPNAWQHPEAHVIVFEGQVFREREPNGSVQELKV